MLFLQHFPHLRSTSGDAVRNGQSESGDPRQFVQLQQVPWAFQPGQVAWGSHRPWVWGTEEARCEDLGRAADEDTRGIASCDKPTECNRCGQMTVKTKGFLRELQVLQHGYTQAQYPNGCSYCTSQQQPQQKPRQYCNHCSQHSMRVPGGFCASCAKCSHGYSERVSMVALMSMMPKSSASSPERIFRVWRPSKRSQ